MHKLTANLVNARGTSCLTITMSRNQPKLGKKPVKGRRISSQSKYIVKSVRAYFAKEKLKGSCIKRLSVAKRTALVLSYWSVIKNHQSNSSGVRKS